MTTHEYVLQHSEEELERLEAQGAFLDASTRDFLERAGVHRGMRVLDVGCGAGDVSFLAAQLVGPAGEVVGIDRSEAALSAARARAQRRGTSNVEFLQRELDSLDDLARPPFDAVVSRLVLIHHAQPADAVTYLVRLLRPGGALCLQEIDLDARYWSTHPLSMLDKLWATVDQVTLRGGFTGNLSGVFAHTFERLGLVDRRIIRSGAIECASDPAVYPWLGGFVRTLSDVANRMGIAHELTPETYEQQLRAEVEAKQAAFIPVHFLGAAGRVPRRRS